MIGLTADETAEFERLDHQFSIDQSGNCAWDFESEPKTRDERRWLDLYRKHEAAWTAWLVTEGQWVAGVPLEPSSVRF
jgi:hypothetical protein